MKEEVYLGEVLRSYLHDIGGEDVVRLGEISRKWKEIAGERLSRWSEPSSLRDGELTVTAPAPAWVNEIHMASESIGRKIYEETGISVEGIRVRTSREAPKEPLDPEISKDKQEG